MAYLLFCNTDNYNTMAKIGINTRRAIYERDGGCLVCKTTENLTVDHIVPVSKGGTNIYENLQTLCGEHNLEKGSNIIDYRNPPIILEGKNTTVKHIKGAKYIVNRKGYICYLQGYLIRTINSNLRIGSRVYFSELERTFIVGRGPKTKAYQYQDLFPHIGTKEQYINIIRTGQIEESNREGLLQLAIDTIPEKQIVYQDRPYILYGYLKETLSYVGVKFKIGTPVYYNEDEEIFIVYITKIKKIAYYYDSLIEYIGSKTKPIKPKTKPIYYNPPSINFNHPNIQSIPPIVKPRPKDYFSENYTKEEQKNFHYD